jgi:glutaredoxin
MKLIRAILSPIILFIDWLTRPKALERAPELQRFIDAQTTRLKLYQFDACPFCVKVRRHLRRRSLNIELRDVKKNRNWEKELVSEGGQFQVPCLRIESDEGPVRWLYESDDIIRYLDERFPAEQRSAS